MSILALLAVFLTSSIPADSPGSGWTATFSIAARDTLNGELGIAVASCVPFVGYSVPWVEAGVGAVATQAFVNHAFGPDGLALLASGMLAPEVLDSLIAGDPDHEQRQVGIVDTHGNSVSFTGAQTMDWAGGVTGSGYAIQGNILTDSGVVLAMEQAYLAAGGPLADRLLLALQAGEDAGGDSRGKQSASILVVREGAGHQGASDILLDLCVSDNPEPVTELRRLYAIWAEYNLFPVYMDAGTDLEEGWALQIMERSLAAEDPDPQMLNYYAWTLAERDLQLPRAEEMARQALDLAPDDPNIMDTLAEVLFRLGNPAEAIEWERKALELDPENAYYLEQIARFEGE